MKTTIYNYGDIEQFLELAIMDIHTSKNDAALAISAIQSTKDFGLANEKTALTTIEMMVELRNRLDESIKVQSASLSISEFSKVSAREIATHAGISPATLKDWVNSSEVFDEDKFDAENS